MVNSCILITTWLYTCCKGLIVDHEGVHQIIDQQHRIAAAATISEVVPGLVELEVAVPCSRPAVW